MHTIAHCSIHLRGSAPPSEFRLFTRGANKTAKGTFVFDEEAARSVMAAYAEHGVDLAIDLEHQMLEPGVPSEPNARDARGWFALEVRGDGSLWAVNVKWTADGIARLAEKRQRYVSPAFEIDPETMRITKIINCAITALPATHKTPALVAAAARGETNMNPDQVKEALDALIAGDAEKCAELLKEIIASAASGTGEDSAPPPPKKKTPPPASDPSTDPAAADAQTMATSLMRLTGTATVTDALGEVMALAKRCQELQVEKEAFVVAERRRLCSLLVTEAGQAPATVWADTLAKVPTPKPFLERMTLVELRSHVDDAIAAGGGKRRAALRPPPSTGERVFETSMGPVTLTQSQLRACAEAGARPEAYAENLARLSKAGGGVR